jgi:hypothetical protein
MRDYVTLLGAEQVQSAANTMSHAADEMKRAANMIDDSLRSQRDFLDDWMLRFEAAVEKLSSKPEAA